MDSNEPETDLVERVLQDFGLRRPAHRIRFGYWSLNLLSAAIIWLIMAGFGAMVTTVGVTRAAGSETAAIASTCVFTLFFAAALVALRIRGRAYAEFDPETRQFKVQKGKKAFGALWSPKGLAEFEQMLSEASASYTWV